MLNKLLVLICVFAFAISAQAQETAKSKKKTVKKTVTTTTEEIDESGKKTIKTEKVETDGDSDSDKSYESPEALKKTSDLPSENESWYTLWGLGLGSTSFSGDLGDAYEEVGDSAGADRSSASYAEILGFYWPLEGHKTMLGFIFATVGDSIDLSTGDYRLSYTMLNFSSVHFFGQNIGDGWYIRGDIGLVRSSLEFYDSGIQYDKDSDSKIGILLGGGYALAIGEETRALFGLNIIPMTETEIKGVSYQGNTVTKVKGTAAAFTVGFLF